MESRSKQTSQTSLFQVYLRLRPPLQVPTLRSQQTEPWLIVEPSSPSATTNGTSFEEAARILKPTHITLQPPNDSRKRAVEKFGFTKVFQQDSSQIDLFEQTGTVDIVSNVLNRGRDGLVATLGVTGSGKSHTILGSRSERGITQMTLDAIFRSLGCHIRRPDHPELPTDHGLLQALQAADPSEAQIISANAFIDAIYSDGDRGRTSRAQTPMIGTRSRAETPSMVWHPLHSIPEERISEFFSMAPSEGTRSPSITYPDLVIAENLDSRSTSGAMTPSIRLLPSKKVLPGGHPRPQVKSTHKQSASKKLANSRVALLKEPTAHPPRRHHLPRPSDLPQIPDITHHTIDIDPTAEYVVIVSMYEVYNDRIFDLLSSSLDSPKTAMTTRSAALQKELKRRPLLFKPTEMSPDRKMVVGLRKVICGSYDEAMMVLETGLVERRVAGTGSNSVSSRSHGFFCIEVKKKSAMRRYDDWEGGMLSIVDLAGSERARNARTAGATLAEAGKINESLMYLGQCLQMQSDCQQDGSKPTLVPFRQCKLTELLFSNSFPSPSSQSHRSAHHHHPEPQRATMIVTADPLGDFNATSQILRYSALAREVTVPRIPSTTSTHILPAPGATGTGRGANPPSRSGGNSPQHMTEDLEAAAAEIVRLESELDLLALRCAEEEILRREAELRAVAAEEKCLEIEGAVREEVWAEMEERIEEEKGRWRSVLEGEREEREGYVDGKIEIAARGQQSGRGEEEEGAGMVKVYEDGDDREELVRTNEILSHRVEELEREITGRSPTKPARRLSPRKKNSTSTSQQQPQPLKEIRNLSLLADPFLNTDQYEVKEVKIKREEDDANDTTFTLGRTPDPHPDLKPDPNLGFGLGLDVDIDVDVDVSLGRLSLLPSPPQAGDDGGDRGNDDVLSPTTDKLKLSLSGTPNRRVTSISSTISSTVPSVRMSDLDLDIDKMIFGAFPAPPSAATATAIGSSEVSPNGNGNGGGGGITVPKTPRPVATTATANTTAKMTPRTVSGTAKRMRKLTTRKWDLGNEDELDDAL